MTMNMTSFHNRKLGNGSKQANEKHEEMVTGNFYDYPCCIFFLVIFVDIHSRVYF